MKNIKFPTLSPHLQSVDLNENDNKHQYIPGIYDTTDIFYISQRWDSYSAYAVHELKEMILVEFGRIILTIAIETDEIVEVSRRRILIIVDDSSNKNKTRELFKQELLNSLSSMAERYHPNFQIFLILFSEYWMFIQSGDAFIQTALRKFTSLYDRGFFVPFKVLVLKENYDIGYGDDELDDEIRKVIYKGIGDVSDEDEGIDVSYEESEYIDQLRLSIKQSNIHRVIYDDDLKIIEKYSSRMLNKFVNYIMSIVVFGSSLNRSKPTDTDLTVIINDTDVRKMTLEDLKRELTEISDIIARETNRRLHIQTMVLTQFLSSTLFGDPFCFNLLGKGFIIYDRNFFMTSIQKLYRRDAIRPNNKAKDLLRNRAMVSLRAFNNVKKQEVFHVIYDAVVEISQALLSELDIDPPSPRECYALLKENFVEKRGKLSLNDIQIVKDIVTIYKDIERRIKIAQQEDREAELNDILFGQLDSLYSKAIEYGHKIENVIKEIKGCKNSSHLERFIQFIP